MYVYDRLVDVRVCMYVYDRLVDVRVCMYVLCMRIVAFSYMSIYMLITIRDSMVAYLSMYI